MMNSLTSSQSPPQEEFCQNLMKNSMFSHIEQEKIHVEQDKYVSSMNALTFKQTDTVIIFDWDDTLLPSSWADTNRFLDAERENLPDVARQTLESLAVAVSKALGCALKRGTVFIITNAEQGWVELSAAKFMPQVLPLLANIKIVSARCQYEHMYPNSPVAWKAAAFGREIAEVLGCDRASLNSMKNLLSFGDSSNERTAARIIASQRLVRIKSIKFIELPAPEELRRQIEYVTSSFDSVCNYDGDLDLMFTAEMTKTVSA